MECYKYNRTDSFFIAAISFFGPIVIGPMLIGEQYTFTWMHSVFIFLGILLILFIPIKRIWNAYYAGYEIDLDQKTFSFPASDIENSIMDIITLKRIRNLMHRDTLNLNEIEALNNETKRWTSKSKDSNGNTVTKKHVNYLLNISGEFGSRQFSFSNKQKRDECRAMFNKAIKQLGLKINSSDMNLDL